MATLTILIYLWVVPIPTHYEIQVEACTNEIREEVLEVYRPINYKMIVTHCDQTIKETAE